MEKKMENDMETGILGSFIRIFRRQHCFAAHLYEIFVGIGV